MINVRSWSLLIGCALTAREVLWSVLCTVEWDELVGFAGLCSLVLRYAVLHLVALHIVCATLALLRWTGLGRTMFCLAHCALAHCALAHLAHSDSLVFDLPEISTLGNSAQQQKGGPYGSCHPLFAKRGFRYYSKLPWPRQERQEAPKSLCLALIPIV